MPRTDGVRPLDLRHGRVDLTHGAGGRASAQLVDELFARAFDNDYLRQGNDGAVLATPPDLLTGGHLVMATDAHVVTPLFFPGGDLGRLAVHGTVNDVAMLGATPWYLSASFILEEGFPLADLARLVGSMAEAAAAAGVPIVTGDTKVVPQGQADGVYVSTTGLGVVPPGFDVGGGNASPGDAVLVSGTVGDHGTAILSLRESLAFETMLVSDTCALHTLVAALRDVATAHGDPLALRTLRDPTRGGLAATLHEIARQSAVGLSLDEPAIPVHPQVAAACELLGLDPLSMASEGRLIAIVAPEAADAMLAAMRAHPHGAGAARIGTVTDDPHRFVRLRTAFGGERIVDWPNGEPLPRIC